MKDNSNPITKNVATRPNSNICVVVQPVVLASLIEVIPTPASAPTITSAITDMTIVLIFTIVSTPIYSHTKGVELVEPQIQPHQSMSLL
jgi:hypothetical protein